MDEAGIFKIMDAPDREKNSTSAIREYRRAISQKMFGYIAAGLGLVAGLAWNDTIRLIIDRLIPDTGSTIIARLLYAVAVTILVGAVLFYMERASK